jgi:hypothetical protein
MKIGTSHFVSRAAAVRYYRAQGGEPDAEHAVKRKLAEGLIHIGEPALKPGQRLEQDASEGRYFIVEADTEKTHFRFRYREGVKYVAPHKPAPESFVRCGTCHRAWDDSLSTAWTPAPSGRCPFEYWHR